jgi:hypothetical protein
MKSLKRKMQRADMALKAAEAAEKAQRIAQTKAKALGYDPLIASSENRRSPDPPPPASQRQPAPKTKKRKLHPFPRLEHNPQHLWFISDNTGIEDIAVMTRLTDERIVAETNEDI